MDSDEEELAQLRASRATSSGLPAARLDELRKKQKMAQNGSAVYLEPSAPTSRGAMAGDSDEDEDEEPGGAQELEDEPMDDDELRHQFPQAFGEQEKKVENLEKVHAETLRGGFRRVDGEPPPGSGGDAGEVVGPVPPAAEEAAEPQPLVGPIAPEAGDVEEDPYNLPITHEVTLEGDAFLSVSGSAQIKIYDRDGLERGESLRGDMYIRDQRNTKGHVSPATGGHWSPTDRGTAMTCSEDGTLRLWDTAEVKQKTVIKPQLQKPGRVSVTACAYNADGSSIAAGMMDGSIHIWDAKGSRGRTAEVKAVPVPKAQMMGRQDWRYVSGGAQSVVRRAHPPDTDITSLAFSRDNITLLSRAGDDTLKVWDLRKMKTPVVEFGDLPNLVSTTQVCFAPEDRLVITGTSANRDGQGAALVFVDLQKQEVVRRVGMPASVVSLQWHSRLNQIFVGTGDKTAGAVRALYNPSLSERGVLFCAHRKPRPKDPFDFQAPLVIHNPHALPLFREERGNKRHLDGRTKDAGTRTKPDVGATTLKGTGTGGQIGVTGGTLLTQFVLKNQGKLNNPRDEDIRTKILRHEDPKDKTTSLFSRAYAKTQPQRIYAEDDEEEEGKKDKN